MVDFYLSLYFFSFFKQRGILGYAIQTSIIVLILFYILSRFANVLGQFPNFINLICSLNKVVYTCVWDFFVSWLKESGNYMCGAHFMS